MFDSSLMAFLLMDNPRYPIITFKLNCTFEKKAPSLLCNGWMREMCFTGMPDIGIKLFGFAYPIDINKLKGFDRGNQDGLII